MVLIDVHAHSYYLKKEKYYEKGVIVIENGVDSKSNKECLKLGFENVNVKVALGWHPTHSYTKEEYEESLKEIEFVRQNEDKIVAIGEIGLDYFHKKTDEVKKWQKKTFMAYLDLAKELDLPVIIHAWNSVKDVLEILDKFSGKVVMHCMEASFKNIQIAIDRGYFFTIPASVGRNELFQRLVSMVPTSKMLTETDLPFQGPTKGVEAKSTDVIFAIEYIAEIKGLDVEEVKNIIFMNYNKVF